MELQERIVGSMDKNDLAGSFRLVDKATAARCNGPNNTIICLSQPVPCHAFAVKWLAPGTARSLTPRQHKQLLCLTAASGVLPNFKVAVQVMAGVGCPPDNEVFTAAAGAGHLHLCEWMWDR